MINFYPYKITLLQWLRLLFTGRTVYLAVELNQVGQPAALCIVSREPKGALPLTQDAIAEQQKVFQANAEAAQDVESSNDRKGCKE